MNFILTLLMYIVFGAVVLMVGILLTKDQGKSYQGAFNESLAWGTGFFVMLSVQVAVIATMF